MEVKEIVNTEMEQAGAEILSSVPTPVKINVERMWAK